MFKSKFLSVALFGSLALVALAPASYATVLAPGGTVAVYSDFAAGTFGAVVADTGIQAVTGVDALNAVTFTGFFRQIVVTDTVTGFLDFLYQVQRSGGPDAIGRVTTTNYTPAITDVGICSACADLIAPVGPTKFAPESIGRSGSGNVVEFQFDPSAVITGNNESFVLVIRTNLPAYIPGSTSIIDGGIDNVNSFAPSAVPEPVSAGLLLGTLFGAGLFVARRFRVVQS